MYEYGMLHRIRIGDFDVGGGKTFIVGELSANHDGSLDTALRTVRALKEAGADAVKIQSYTPDSMTLDCDSELFRIKQGTIWDGLTLYELYRKAYTPPEWHEAIFRTAEESGIMCFSSVFDRSAADMLERLDVPAYKIASFELTDLDLIGYAAAKGRPMIISTGLGTLGEIKDAVDVCRKVGNHDIILLKCTSSYPASPDSLNLRTIPNMRDTFGVVVGLSDHTAGINAPVAAVALGAKVIEKHVKLDESVGGPDSSFSLNIEDFKRMVDAIRDIEKALGKVEYGLEESSAGSRELIRSLFFVEDLLEGEILSRKNVRSIRPGFGLPPKYLKDIIGKKAVMHIKRGTPVGWGMFR